MHLSEIKSPNDLKRCGHDDLKMIAAEIRSTIIDTVASNGGHLSSNLGTVELTMALHLAFDCPNDKIVFDVGHQCYTHKLLTGRYGSFQTLRTFSGMSGYPNPSESEYDIFGTGHASSAISQALGLARARDLRGETHHVVAVVGDGALTGGMCFEALNDVGESKTPLIIILNDNEMSISRNVGSISSYLTHLRVSKGWIHAKRAIARSLKRIPVIGMRLHDLFQRFKNSIRNFFIRDSLFSSLGIQYLGPIDGHDLATMTRVFSQAASLDEPVLIHIMTKKGLGYPLAEENPDLFHGTPPFDKKTGRPVSSSGESFGAHASALLCESAQKDSRITAIVAAMAEGTGFTSFRSAFPDRFFDVGIAEEHAVSLAAGMAAGGMRPFVAIYDTFLQRAYDQIITDVCLRSLPVCFLIDRAMSGEDGPSHHGVFGTSTLRHIPNLTLLYPRCLSELSAMILYALSSNNPVAIRYPRTEAQQQMPYKAEEYHPGCWEKLLDGKDCALLAVGGMVATALHVRGALAQSGIRAAVYNASSIKPLDHQALDSLRSTPIVTIEENVLFGGFGGAVSEYCIQSGIRSPIDLIAIPDRFIPQGAHDTLLSSLGMDASSIAARIKSALDKERLK